MFPVAAKRRRPNDASGAFVRARGLSSRGAGWIDIHLLASPLVSGMKLWTADASLYALASELSIAYTVPEPRRKYLT